VISFRRIPDSKLHLIEMSPDKGWQLKLGFKLKDPGGGGQSHNAQAIPPGWD